MRFSLRQLFIGVAVIAILAALIGGIIRYASRTYGSFEEFYAVDQTYLMLTDYVIANDGRWPSSWDDIEPYFGRHKHLGWSEDFESHKKLVDVDFSFVPDDYFARETQTLLAQPKLISLKSHRNNMGWEELEEVNRRLMETLRSRYVTD